MFETRPYAMPPRMDWQGYPVRYLPPGTPRFREGGYTRVETIIENPSFWDFLWGNPYPRRCRPRTLAEYVSSLLFYTVSTAVILIVGTIVMWAIFSATVFRQHYTPICLLGATPDREYSATDECVLTVHLNTRCSEDIQSELATFSEMAARWPHAVSLLGGAAITNLFITVFICDVWRQKTWMLLIAWTSFFLFWGVVSTSQFECDDQLRTGHFSLSAALIVFSTLYAYLGTFNRSDGAQDPAYGYIARTWSPLYLWVPLLGLVGIAAGLFVAGFFTWSLGNQADGGGNDYDYWRNLLAILEIVYLSILTVYVVIFAWETSDALTVTAAGGELVYPRSPHHTLRETRPQQVYPHRCVHDSERPEGRGQRAWRLVTAK